MISPAPAPLDISLARSRHVIAVPSDVDALEVEALALSRYPLALWAEEDTLQLEPEVYLSGPFAATEAVHQGLNLPQAMTAVYMLTCPADRGEPVPPALRQTGGLLAAFAEGAVAGRELEALEFLLALGRRVGGFVRTSTGHILGPEEWAGVDLNIYAPVWLFPDALEHVLSPILEGIEISDQGSTVMPVEAINADDASVIEAQRAAGLTELDAGAKAWLAAEADAYDQHALSQPQVQEGYGALWHFPSAGLIAVSVAAAETIPLAVAGEEWASGAVMHYELRWHSANPQGWMRKVPPAALREECAHARVLIERAAAAVIAATGGACTDDDGFLVRF